MSRAVHILAFLGLSTALHAGVLAVLPGGGGAGEGQGGTATATLAPAAPGLSALVDRWMAAPEMSARPDRPMEPADEAPPAAPRTASVPPPVTLPPAGPALPLADAVPRISPPAPRGSVVPGAPAALSAPDVSADPVFPVASGVAPPPAAPVRIEAPGIDARPETGAAPAAPLAVTHSPRPAARPERATAAAPPQAGPPQTGQRASGGSDGATRGSVSDTGDATSDGPARRQLMARWGAQIQSRIERRRPRVEGTGAVMLQITVARDGTLQSVAIARSSGDAAIDRAGVAAVRRAGRLPAAPEGLRQPSYRFNVPIRFL